MRGSFNLRRTEATPFATRYVIENAQFTAGDYVFTGGGTYETSGDFVLRQTMTLTGELKTSSATNTVGFANNTGAITRRWPMLAATLTQTNGTLGSTITVTIAAAPLREIWFSTATNFTRAIKVDNTVSDGDLLSSAGRIVKRNGDLQNFPGPTYLNIGLDAMDMLPGAEIAFSAETKGVLNDGDIAISPTGTVSRWQDFMPLVAPNLSEDPGLDALQFEGSNKIYFSTKRDFDSPVGTIGNGDILLVDTDAPTGSIFRKNSDLLGRFHPSDATDVGLDALFIWWSGEIWFSTTTGFMDGELGQISTGDLLSDAGYIVYRNSDLTAALQPVGDAPTDFGLDAVYVISDSSAAPEGAKIDAVIVPGNDSILLNWAGQGRVFQVQRARDINGPWEAITPIIPELNYEDLDTISGKQRAFYRVRQW